MDKEDAEHGGNMNVRIRHFLLLIICLYILVQPAWAAPVSPILQQIRHHADGDTIRVVLDISDLVPYTVTQQDGLLSVTVELDKAVIQSSLKPQEINDSSVPAVRFVNATAEKKAQVIVDCRQPVSFKVFSLTSPNRIVIDITKLQEQKNEQEIAAGIRYTSWYKSGPAGPLNVHILDISPQSGYTLEPMLVKQNVLGIDTLSQVLLHNDVLAAVNASYFAPNGDIIGLLKQADEVISSSNIARTALCMTGEGKLLIDQVGYQGVAEFSDNLNLPLSGVNESRGENGLVLYNRFWGTTTKTNSFGIEYTIIGGAVSAIQIGNSTIPDNGYVLSAHGETAKKLTGVKIGDSARALQTLGPVWDQTSFVIGAGPMLVKQGEVFVTTKLEEFGSDVAGGRAPRTAVGLGRDGRILLVVVDGRQTVSRGMSLLELALFMRELGAVNAMNLDGGGSSEMIVKGRIVNKPSDGKERRIGNALAVVPSKLAI